MKIMETLRFCVILFGLVSGSSLTERLARDVNLTIKENLNGNLTGPYELFQTG